MLYHVYTLNRRPRIYDNNVATHDWSDAIADEFRSALRNSQKLKSLMIDKVPHFWLHSLPSIHNALAAIYSEIMNNPETSPWCLSKGLTNLLAKNYSYIDSQK